MSALDLGRGMLDLLFPPHCQVCSRYGDWFCPFCRRQIEPAARIAGAGALDEIASVGAHWGPLREAVLALKFAGKLSLAQPLGDLVAGVLADVWDDWQPAVLLPVPIHWLRELHRGFNQSELLARAAASRLRLPVTGSALVRQRRRRPQVGLTAPERSHNVRGAFRAGNHEVIRGRSLVLVDDVCTTGSTLTECALMLKTAGARRVYGLTVTTELETAAV
jgi:ComF family protein